MTKKNTDNPVVGVDLGGTKVLAGVVDVSGKVLRTAKHATKPEVRVGRSWNVSRNRPRCR